MSVTYDDNLVATVAALLVGPWRKLPLGEADTSAQVDDCIDLAYEIVERVKDHKKRAKPPRPRTTDRIIADIDAQGELL